MTDNHFMFLVTLPIHDGSNENSEKCSWIIQAGWIKKVATLAEI